MSDKGEFGLLEFEFIEQIKKLENTHGQTEWNEIKVQNRNLKCHK